MRKWI